MGNRTHKKTIARALHIESGIAVLRGETVILDYDLARLYGVHTKRLNEQLRRNRKKFPPDFAFQLNVQEFASLISKPGTGEPQKAAGERLPPNWSQFATSSSRHRGAAYRPWAFTEHGALQAANILNSERATAMSIYVIRAFVKMREQQATHQAVLRHVAEIDRTLLTHDTALRDIYRKLRPLLLPPPEPTRREIGFHVKLDEAAKSKRAAAKIRCVASLA